jgi:hypothetical protein
VIVPRGLKAERVSIRVDLGVIKTILIIMITMVGTGK